MGTKRLALSVVALSIGGCTIELPDPAGYNSELTNWLNQVARQAQDAVTNPLDQKLYPLLLGGDSERIFYATNLGDVRITYAGPTNDWVFPGILGPSNLYVYENGERRLARPLVAAGSLSRMSFDGESIAFVLSQNIGTTDFTESVVVSRAAFDNLALLDAPLADGAFITSVAINRNRVAVLLDSASDQIPDRIRLYDLDSPTDPDEFSADQIDEMVLRGDRLAYSVNGSGIVLADLVTRTTTDIRTGDSPWDLTLADNHVVWTTRGSGDGSTVYAYSMTDATTQLWLDAIDGRLAGATDDQFVTEAINLESNGRTAHVTIRRYDVGGGARVLADFREDGLAGQTMVLGNRVVFVNADRKIVVVPFDGGGRFNLRPY